MREASLKIGQNHSYLQQHIKRGVPRKLPEDVRKALATLLDVDEAVLRDESAPPPGLSGAPATFGAFPFKPVPIEAPTAERDLPVFGSVKGSPDGEMVDVLNPVDWIVRPRSLEGSPRAFAIYVVGDSQEPRFRRGDMLLVRPGMPARRGDDVVVVFADNNALVKIYLRRDDKICELEQLNPAKRLKFPTAQIAEIHVVTGWERGR